MADVPGTVTLETRVIERLAARAAANAAREPQNQPRPRAKARADVAGRRARVLVETAAFWPEPAATAGARIAARVRQELADFAGVQADQVNVAVVDVLMPGPPTPRTVR
ncbi:hypothetical protein [Ruania alba]|uniref:Asp23/Gls24 family envelope stress response protein n=1 Tax=Ruania alba TaxID=648782 RepID=A0A1H5LU35_9MICO|nr:hypothetical protein [Ruania alba]SEE80562.1 hypothetical protein SAMN04488554_2982 [Ruania alba]